MTEPMIEPVIEYVAWVDANGRVKRTAHGLPGLAASQIAPVGSTVEICSSIVQPGWIRQGETFAPPPAPVRTIDERRGQRKAQANAYRLMVAAAGIATPSGHHLQTPPESQLNFVGLVSMAREAKEAGLPFEQPVRMLDNSSIPHNAEQMIALGLLIGRHIAACSAAYFDIADEINASDDPESIDITAGYPVEGAA